MIQSAVRTTSPTPSASAARGDRWPATRDPALRMRPGPRGARRAPRSFFDARAFERAAFGRRARLDGISDLHDHGHDNRLSLRNLEKVLAERAADVLLQHALVGHLVGRALLERLHRAIARLLEDRIGGVV